jgi:riboflavin kinase/FMN adenylyltransferase
VDVKRAIVDIDRPYLRPVCTIGNFDGVHLGHQKLLTEVTEEARRVHGTSVVITFRPHPLEVLRPGTAPALVVPYQDRLALLERLGVHAVAELHFDERLAAMEARAFVEEVIWRRLGAMSVIVGPDCQFGKGRGGNVALLAEVGLKAGFAAREVAPVVIDGVRVSSSSVREALARGDVEQAGRFLGRHFRLRGEVVHGDGRGREIGFPTANLMCAREQLVPAAAIYAGRAMVGRDMYSAAVSIGTRPTFGGRTLAIEAYLVDFQGDLYGRRIALDLVARLRGQVAFRSVTDLIAQIQADVEETGRVLGTHSG